MAETKPPPLKNRVIEVRQVDPAKLKPNPNNPRVHGAGQREAFRAVLDEIGFAGALLARKKGRGLELIDGHLRAEELPAGEKVPVVVVDLSEDEARKLAAVYDPIAGLADYDGAKIDALLEGTEFEQEALTAIIDSIKPSVPIPPSTFPEVDPGTITTHYRCPKCSYEWSGKPK